MAVFTRSGAGTSAKDTVILGINDQPGPNSGSAIRGEKIQSKNHGVLGSAEHGVTGVAHSDGGVGVAGSTNENGEAGVVGESHGDRAQYGVVGRTIAPDTGTGVYGYATATHGLTHGVRGEIYTDGQPWGPGQWLAAGVKGHAKNTDATAAAVGVYGLNASRVDGATAVLGSAYAKTGATCGVKGETASANNDAVGVLGVASESRAGWTYGVHGVTASEGFAAAGVFGLASARRGGNFGVIGRSDSPNGYGVVSIGNAWISGTVHVTGAKHAVVETSQGMRALHCEEAPNAWFSDYGFGRIEGDGTWIDVDPLFAEVANLDQPYHVFLQPYGDADLFVSQRTPEGFEVRLRESSTGDSEAEFSYRIVAKRRGYEDSRLEQISSEALDVAMSAEVSSSPTPEEMDSSEDR